jgi:hypothetical protein
MIAKSLDGPCFGTAARRSFDRDSGAENATEIGYPEQQNKEHRQDEGELHDGLAPRR